MAAGATKDEGLGPPSVVLAAFLCGVFAFISLYSTQPLLPYLASVFRASKHEVSATISASTLGVAFSAALLALFGERLPRKRTIVASMLLMGTCTFLASTARTLPQLYVWRLLQGLVTPGIFVMAISYITEQWPATRMPRIMSIYVSGTVFGGFLGRITAGALAERTGWRSVFVVLGALGVVGAALTQWLLEPAAARPSASNARLDPVLRNFRELRLLATFGIGFCMLFALVSTFSYITFYLAAPPFSLSTEQLSWLFSVYLLGLVVTLVVGRMLVRIGLRRGLLGAIASVVTGLLVTLVPSLFAVGIGLALVGAGVFVAQTCTNSFLRDAAPAGSRVSAAGTYVSCYYIGGTVGGIAPAIAWRAGGWPGCVALTCALLGVAATLAFFGWRTRPPLRDPVPL
ncbi:MAG: MFS transporter [Polyangia bacterium]